MFAEVARVFAGDNEKIYSFNKILDNTPMTDINDTAADQRQIKMMARYGYCGPMISVR